MKNWLVPITVLGVSTLGLLFASERGRAQMKALLHQLANAKDPLGEFNHKVEQELDHIQEMLDQLSQALKA